MADGTSPRVGGGGQRHTLAGLGKATVAQPISWDPCLSRKNAELYYKEVEW